MMTKDESIKSIELPYTDSGVIAFVEAIHKGIIIGTGYIIWTPDFGMSPPSLVNNIGEVLPEGWYDIRCIEDKLAIISFRTH